jgi:hypothetical protein
MNSRRSHIVKPYSRSGSASKCRREIDNDRISFNGYQSILVVRYNPNIKTVFIITDATESLKILIFPNGLSYI